MLELKDFTIICGHYGCGKTNLALNLALDMADGGERVTLVDLDIVNPYFRSSDYAALLESRGVRVIAPNYAGSTLDIPALPAEIFSAFEAEGRVVLDVGGDDAGATALGRFSGKLRGRDYDMLYVVNKYRPLTGEPGEAAALLREIEAASHLKATGVVNNSHLKQFTDAATVRDSLPYARETAEALSLPLRFTTAPEALAGELAGAGEIYPVKVYVLTPWGS